MTARNKGEYESINDQFGRNIVNEIYQTRLTKPERQLIKKRCELDKQNWTYDLKVNPDGTHSFIPRDI
jgi:hypothetical protein